MEQWVEAVEGSVELRLQKAEKALERCEKTALASMFTGAIMHEVNNPLEAITNLVYLTKLQKEDPELVMENMLIIEQQLETLGNVAKQALTFHRKETEAKEWDLIEIVGAALKLHADKITRHKVNVSHHFMQPAIAKVIGTEILQVVSNLILNAIDAVADTHGSIHVRVKMVGRSVHITICDTGSGIPETIKPRLFEPYMTSKPAGTGIGLWLSRRIIEKHRGTIRFRSSQKQGRQGTTFRVSLPLV